MIDKFNYMKLFNSIKNISVSLAGLFLTSCFLLTICKLSVAQTSPKGLAIGLTQFDPHPSALLDVQSQSQGVRFPTMTALQRDNIANPAAGLIVYVNDPVDRSFYYYDGLTWKAIAQGTGGGS